MSNGTPYLSTLVYMPSHIFPESNVFYPFSSHTPMKWKIQKRKKGILPHRVAKRHSKKYTPWSSLVNGGKGAEIANGAFLKQRGLQALSERLNDKQRGTSFHTLWHSKVQEMCM